MGGYTTISVVHSPTDGNLGCLHLWLLYMEVLYNHGSLYEHIFLVLLDKCLEVELLAHSLSTCFTLSVIAKLFFKVSIQFWISTSYV